MQLAQLNIAQMLYADDDPRMADFFENIERINALAEASPGFVWRFQDESGGATETRPLGSDWLVNLSVWQNADTLKAFAYKSDHKDFVRRRSQWFVTSASPALVLWWVPVGYRPSPAEAIERHRLLQEQGPTPAAFTFAKIFPAEGTDV